MHFLRTCIKHLHPTRHETSRGAELTLGGPSWYPPIEDVVTDDELLEYVVNMARCSPNSTMLSDREYRDSAIEDLTFV